MSSTICRGERLGGWYGCRQGVEPSNSSLMTKPLACRATPRFPWPSPCHAINKQTNLRTHGARGKPKDVASFCIRGVCAAHSVEPTQVLEQSGELIVETSRAPGFLVCFAFSCNCVLICVKQKGAFGCAQINIDKSSMAEQSLVQTYFLTSSQPMQRCGIRHWRFVLPC